MIKRITQVKTKEDIQVLLLFILFIFILFVKIYMVMIYPPNDNNISSHQISAPDHQYISLPGSSANGSNTSIIK